MIYVKADGLIGDYPVGSIQCSVFSGQWSVGDGQQVMDAEESWFPWIDTDVCTSCGDCVACCPTGALAMAGAVAVVASPAACRYCGDCEVICPVEAIALPYQIVVEADPWPAC